MSIILLLAAAVSACGFSLVAQLDEPAQFPKEFRTWAHVKSVLVGPKSAAFTTEGGIHHIYANEKALEGYKTGKFPDGSDLLETKEADGNTMEASTRRIDVMVKQSELYKTTGGWEYMSFPGGNPADGKLSAERQASCATCHANRKDHDSVYSEFRN